MAYVDINERDLAVRYSQGVSDGIARAYGVPVRYPDYAGPSPAYTRGFRNGWSATWRARHRTSGKKLPGVREYMQLQQELKKVRMSGWFDDPSVMPTPPLQKSVIVTGLG